MTKITLHEIYYPRQWAYTYFASLFSLHSIMYTLGLVVISVIAQVFHLMYSTVRRSTPLSRIDKFLGFVHMLPFILGCMTFGLAYAFCYNQEGGPLFYEKGQPNENKFFVCTVGLWTGWVYALSYWKYEEGHLRFPERHDDFVHSVCAHLERAITRAVPLTFRTIVCLVPAVWYGRTNLPLSWTVNYLPDTTGLGVLQYVQLLCIACYYNMLVASTLLAIQELVELFRTSHNNRIAIFNGPLAGTQGRPGNDQIHPTLRASTTTINAEELLWMMEADLRYPNAAYNKYRAFELLQRRVNGDLEWGLFLLDADVSQPNAGEGMQTISKTPAIVFILQQCVDILQMQILWVESERSSRNATAALPGTLVNPYLAHDSLRAPTFEPTWREIVNAKANDVITDIRMYLAHLLLGRADTFATHAHVSTVLPEEPGAFDRTCGVPFQNGGCRTEEVGIRYAVQGPDRRFGETHGLSAPYGVRSRQTTLDGGVAAAPSVMNVATPPQSGYLILDNTWGAKNKALVALLMHIPGSRYFTRSLEELRTRAVFADYQLVVWAMRAATQIVINGANIHTRLGKTLLRSGMAVTLLNQLLECLVAVELHNADPLHNLDDPSSGLRGDVRKRQATAMIEVLEQSLYSLSNAYRKQIPGMKIQRPDKLAKYLS
ncbi:hypothetical protein SARC_01673 [Sphaeroforma arctica JP610]|uniref:Nucleoporin NDC1 n=1 Tax=Sphaeroforma arctica JP610 TaxID=667725 RepID=A0A0L0GBC8_9EUKA|nr:hypothetical protein SARC_01673 [Sphaeroforma arctica JP610]KNC86196.1 hypothetical protein SARC_01673 [Sphaeroforma arctica JP610]|eukprot:XP_014160098.1 hypothetical protein SARC_01673 [Sphaeroforma arctica JP610]